MHVGSLASEAASGQYGRGAAPSWQQQQVRHGAPQAQRKPEHEPRAKKMHAECMSTLFAKRELAEKERAKGRDISMWQLASPGDGHAALGAGSFAVPRFPTRLPTQRFAPAAEAAQLAAAPSAAAQQLDQRAGGAAGGGLLAARGPSLRQAGSGGMPDDVMPTAGTVAKHLRDARGGAPARHRAAPHDRLAQGQDHHGERPLGVISAGERSVAAVSLGGHGGSRHTAAASIGRAHTPGAIGLGAGAGGGGWQGSGGGQGSGRRGARVATQVCSLHRDLCSLS